MKLYITGKIFIGKDRFTITDENNNLLFRVRDELFKNKTIIIDNQENIVSIVEWEPLKIASSFGIEFGHGNSTSTIEHDSNKLKDIFKIFINNELVCKFIAEQHLLKTDFILDNDYRMEVEGNYSKFTVFDNNNNLIGIINNITKIGATKLEIDCYDDTKIIFLLALAIAIENKKRKDFSEMSTDN